MSKILLLSALIGAQNDLAVLEAVRIAHRENIALFHFGRMKFVASVGNAKSVGAARQGDVSIQHSSSAGSYDFDGISSKYECMFAPDEMMRATKKVGNDMVECQLHSIRVCTDGKRWLLDSCRMNLTKGTYVPNSLITLDSQWQGEFMRCPLRLGKFGAAGSELLHCIDNVRTNTSGKGSADRTLIAVEPSAQLEGRDVCKLSFQFGHLRQDFWVDLARGAIPLRHLVTHPGTTTAYVESNYSDIRAIASAGGAWFPHRESRISHDAAGRVGLIKSIEITDANFANRPTASELTTLQYQKPVRCVDLVSKCSYPPQDRWQLTALPSAKSPGARPLADTPSAPPVRPQPGPSKGIATKWFYVSAMIVGAILLILAYVLRAKSKGMKA